MNAAFSLMSGSEGFVPSVHVFQDRVKMWAEERQLRFLDPREYFDKVGSNDVYLSWDPHFSIEGHKKYADYLAAHIADVIRSN